MFGKILLGLEDVQQEEFNAGYEMEVYVSQLWRRRALTNYILFWKVPSL